MNTAADFKYDCLPLPVRQKQFFRRGIIAVILLLLSQWGNPATAQEKSVELTVFVEKIQSTFQSGTLAELEALFPFEEQRFIYKTVLERKWPRKAGFARVLEETKNNALVLVTGKIEQGDRGLETFYSSFYSGLYSLKKTRQGWKVHRKLPLEEGNRIKKQDLQVNVQPGVGLTVTDTLTLEVGNPFGFFATLNQAARIESISRAGKSLDYTFRDGLLWLPLPRQKEMKVVLSYELPVQNDPVSRSGMGLFTDSAGHVRQNYWHPHLSFSSPADRADFTLSAQIPAAYHLVTSLPQTDTVREGIRLVEARSAYPTSYLALYYDKEWQKSSFLHGNMKIDIFAGRDYRPGPDTLYEVLKNNLILLEEKFGPAQSDYLATVQNRAIRAKYWHSRTNDVIVSAAQGTDILLDKPFPRAIILHEISHGWTAPTGPARLFLVEGWAQFVEAYSLQKTFGDSTVALYWQKLREWYFANPYQGKLSLWNDINTSALSYTKGAFVLKMLQDIYGSTVLEKGLREYIQHPASDRKDIYDFSKALSAAAGRDVWPVLEPWLKSNSVPKVSVRIEKGQLLIEQSGDLFQFPLQVRLTTPAGSTLQTCWVRQRRQYFPVGGVVTSQVSEIEIDPDGNLLLQTE